MANGANKKVDVHGCGLGHARRLAHWEDRLVGLGYARIHRKAIMRLDAVKGAHRSR
ncbi:MAG: hypothetical protein Q8O00_13795 [Holophaga sp.]|nr:hypothetical protein [Holophaga sp.]